MRFTTHLVLESRPTRLFERYIVRGELQVMNGVLTLYDALFQRTYTWVARRPYVYRLQLDDPPGQPIFTLSSSRFTRRY